MNDLGGWLSATRPTAGKVCRLGVEPGSGRLYTCIVNPAYMQGATVELDDAMIRLGGYGTIRSMFMYGTTHCGYLVESLERESILGPLWLFLTKTPDPNRRLKSDVKMRLLLSDPIVNVVHSMVNDYVLVAPTLDPTLKEMER